MQVKKTIALQQNSGFTLIELIVSILVSSVVILSAVLFFSVCLNNYRDTVQETDLMMESQIAVNMIREVVMEANEVPEVGSYSVGDTSYPYFAVKTKHGINDEGVTGDGYYHLFVHDKKGARLLYHREDVGAVVSAQDEIQNTLLADGTIDNEDMKQYFLADYVQQISLNVINPQLPVLSMEFDCDGKVYRTSETILIRNTLPDAKE